jgi:hypothetical protein
MDFLKRHYEKIVLAVALVALIGSAIYLAMRVSQLSSEGPTMRAATHATPIQPIDLTSYSTAIASLTAPPMWTHGNPFKEISTGNYIFSTNTNTNVETQLPITLLSVVRKPFKLLFMTYSYDPAAGGYNFQINFQFRARTFFISQVGEDIKDHYEDTGYRIVKFERKSVAVYDPSFNTTRDKDVSELTVQHEGANPVVLVLGKESEDQEPVAQVRCTADGLTGEYRRGQSLNCKGVTYKVFDIDIDQKQMVIVDSETKEQHIIKYQR